MSAETVRLGGVEPVHEASDVGVLRGEVRPSLEGEVAMAKLTGRYAQVVSKGGPIELVTREVPDPKGGEVRVRVQACGVATAIP